MKNFAIALDARELSNDAAFGRFPKEPSFDARWAANAGVLGTLVELLGLEGGLKRTVCVGVLLAALTGGTCARLAVRAGCSGEVRRAVDRGAKKALLAELDATLHFAASDTKLELKHPVKGVFISRAQVQAELRKRFDEDEGAKRMERSELVLKKMGLLDRDFHLRPFLLSLLIEQIAGFYDDKTHVMTLLDWVPEDQQLPVMAHELTHALQDQRVGLKTWGDQEVKGVAKNTEEDNRHIRSDEADTARQAVLEGQAMVAFADYLLKDKNKTLKDVPEMVDVLKAGEGDMTGSPVMARAPLLLQQALLFPYVEGLVFEAAILMKEGTQRAFGGTLDAPPSSSFEVMHPELYLAKVAAPVMLLPDVHPLLEAGGYAPYDVGVMGEIDVRMTTELFGGKPLAEALAPAWDGGIYYAAQRKSATPTEKESTASLGLLYSSRWKNRDSARSFFTMYENQLPRKYTGVKRRKADEKDDTERVYTTSEGDVLLTLRDDGVYIGEGFDLELSRKLRDMVDAAQGTGPVKEASLPVRGEGLFGGLSNWLGSFGMMKVALR